MKDFRFSYEDFEGDYFTGTECVLFGVIMPAALVAVVALAGLIESLFV